MHKILHELTDGVHGMEFNIYSPPTPVTEPTYRRLRAFSSRAPSTRTAQPEWPEAKQSHLAAETKQSATPPGRTGERGCAASRRYGARARDGGARLGTRVHTCCESATTYLREAVVGGRLVSI
jgi:hypothetical protein